MSVKGSDNYWDSVDRTLVELRTKAVSLCGDGATETDIVKRIKKYVLFISY